MSKGMSKKRLGEILANQHLRKSLAYEDPLWFCLIYLRHHLSNPLAPFHLEMLHLLKERAKDKEREEAKLEKLGAR